MITAEAGCCHEMPCTEIAVTTCHAQILLSQLALHQSCCHDLPCTTLAVTTCHAQILLSQLAQHSSCCHDVPCIALAVMTCHAQILLSQHALHSSCTDLAVTTCHAQILLTDSSFGGQAQVVELEGRPPIAFDVLSVDIGITPSKAVPGSSSVATPVKPISGYESSSCHGVAFWCDVCMFAGRVATDCCSCLLCRGL